jgi:REP element-mobilizing transposase RayT
MKIVEYNNLYTHFVFTTLNRAPIILEKHRERIEKYITGIVNNNACKMYSIYANPEHVHLLISRAPNLDEETLATIISNSSENLSTTIVCVSEFFNGSSRVRHFQYRSVIFASYVCISKINPNIIKQKILQKNTKAMSNFINKQLLRKN